MFIISNPKEVKYIDGENNLGTVEILGCYPNYGSTIGNAIRRVLLSSIEGVAITSVKIKGVSHEFSTIDGIVEDVVQLVLNLKQIRFKFSSSESSSATLYLKYKGEGVIVAGDVIVSSDIKVVNPDQIIATSTDKKLNLDIEIKVERGIGYLPVEQRENKEKDLGVIFLDAIYTPVKRVNYKVENMRVGKRTDYEKVVLEVVTDGSLDYKDAFKRAVSILVDQFSFLNKNEN